jgi:hypothetical protein
MRIDAEALRAVQQSGAHSRPRSRFARAQTSIEPMSVYQAVKLPLLRTAADALATAGAGTAGAGATTAAPVPHGINQYWER